MSDEKIDAIESPEVWAEVFDAQERAVLALADALAGDRTEALDPELVSVLREHFEEPELAELILVAGQANLNNRAGNAAKQVLGDD